jgi:hypothetical protein
MQGAQVSLRACHATFPPMRGLGSHTASPTADIPRSYYVVVQGGGLQDHPDQLQSSNGGAACMACWLCCASSLPMSAVGSLDQTPSSVPRCIQATIMTDPETADKTYIGPMTPDVVAEIIEKVRQAAGGLRAGCASTPCRKHHTVCVSNTGAAGRRAAHHGRADGAEPGKGAL